MQVKLFNTRIDADLIAKDQQEINDFMETVTVKNTATQFVNGSPDFWSILIFYEPNEVKAEPKPKPAKAEPEELTEEQQQIILALKTWRKDKANEFQIPEFMVLRNADLDTLARQKPNRVILLKEVKGMSEAKITRYGEDIIAILNAF